MKEVLIFGVWDAISPLEDTYPGSICALHITNNGEQNVTFNIKVKDYICTYSLFNSEWSQISHFVILSILIIYTNVMPPRGQNETMTCIINSQGHNAIRILPKGMCKSCITHTGCYDVCLIIVHILCNIGCDTSASMVKLCV